MRNRIMVATIEEINENGIKFTMADLARRLAVSKSTIYAHFASKEELIGAIGDTLRESLRQQDDAIMKDDTLNLKEKIKALLLNEPTLLGPITNRFILDLKRFLPEEWKKNDECHAHKWQLIESLLQQGIKCGYIRPIDLNIVKVIFDATINTLLDQKFLTQSNLTIVDAFGKMNDILYYGLAMPDDKQSAK